MFASNISISHHSRFVNHETIKSVERHTLDPATISQSLQPDTIHHLYKAELKKSISQKLSRGKLLVRKWAAIFIIMILSSPHYRKYDCIMNVCPRI